MLVLFQFPLLLLFVEQTILTGCRFEATGELNVKSSKLKFKLINTTNTDICELVETTTTNHSSDVMKNHINMTIIDSNLLTNLSLNNENSTSINFQPYYKVHTNYDDLLINKIIKDTDEFNTMKSLLKSKIRTAATTVTTTTIENENDNTQVLISSSAETKNFEIDSTQNRIRNESLTDSGETLKMLPIYQPLSRSKRYLSFPEGSSFSVAICMTVGIIGNPHYSYMSYGLNWAVAYDLPNATWTLNHLNGFQRRVQPEFIWQRRSRRSLYRQIENFITNMGYNGRQCILRALCESRQYLTNKNKKEKMNMLGEMLKTLFSLPKQHLYSSELKEDAVLEVYDRAYRYTDLKTDCSRQYDCSFSLLALAVGLYSTPPQDYFKHH